MTASRRPQARILVAHRYYWPDSAPYASILRSIVGLWVHEGHEVHVVGGRPAYKGERDPRFTGRSREDGAYINRLDLASDREGAVTRVANALRFIRSVATEAFRLRPLDVVMVSTAPPIAAGVAGRLAAKISGARFVYHCMDVHPEIGAVTGEFGNGTVYRVMRAIDAGTCRSADRIVVLSSDMAMSIRRRKGCAGVHTTVINNFSLPGDDAAPTVQAEIPAGEEVRLLFAGNVGRFQGLERVVRVMHDLNDAGLTNISLSIMGVGPALDGLKECASGGPARERIHFLPHGTVEQAKANMRAATIGVVSLIPGIHEFAFPSKAATYLEQGLPVLAVIETDSALANLLRETGTGVAVSNSDTKELFDTLKGLCDDPAPLKEMRTHAVLVGRQIFSEDACLPLWSELLEAVHRHA